MALQIRRGTQAEADAVIFALGELVYTTDTQKIYVGDGITQGGVDIMANMEGAVSSVNSQVGVVELDTSNIPENNNLYFTDARAVEAVGDDLSRVGATHSGISFVYTGGHIIATVDTGSLVGIQDIVDDTTPQLGGSLDLNSFDINGTGDIDITGGISLTASLTNQDITLTSNRVTSLVTPPTVSDRSDNAFILGSNTNPNTLWVYGDNNFGVFTGISDGTNNAGFTFKISRGTLSAPTTVAAGDAIGFIDPLGYDCTDYVNIDAFGLFADPDGTVSTGIVPGSFGAVVLDSTGTPQTMSFNSKGVLNAPVLKASSYASGSEPASPENGWIIYNSTTGKFQGYSSGVWVDLS